MELTDMAQTPTRLDAKRLAVVQLLARGMEVKDISKRTNIPERTIRQWRKDPVVEAKCQIMAHRSLPLRGR